MIAMLHILRNTLEYPSVGCIIVCAGGTFHLLRVLVLPVARDTRLRSGRPLRIAQSSRKNCHAFSKFSACAGVPTWRADP